jgi:hypothetical protein
MVIAMCYSISITAAEIMMGKIYSSIFNNHSIEVSVAAGRRELYLKKERNAWLGHIINRGQKTDRFLLRACTAVRRFPHW